VPDTDKPTDVAAQLRRALNAVQDMRSRLEAAQAREHEPVAIVGIACILVLAAVYDVILSRTGRALTPWSRKQAVASPQMYTADKVAAL